MIKLKSILEDLPIKLKDLHSTVDINDEPVDKIFSDHHGLEDGSGAPSPMAGVEMDTINSDDDITTGYSAVGGEEGSDGQVFAGLPIPSTSDATDDDPLEEGKHIKLKSLLLEGKMGDCYPAGGRLIMNFFGDKEHKLVHGMVNGQGALEGMRYGHCWVESRDTVLDHSNGRKLEIPKQVYYALGRIDPKECHYYTPEESAKFMAEEGHWGPWEMSGDTVMAEDIPDRKPEIGDQELKISRNELDTIKQLI
tara:strand:- start:3264 stop:4016 length:753 start_codon:yes stop_codon:yes gene_type:complete